MTSRFLCFWVFAGVVLLSTSVWARDIVLLHEQAQESGWSAAFEQGIQAEAEALYGAEDLLIRQIFLGGAGLDPEQYETVYETLVGKGDPMPMGVVTDGETAFGFARKYGGDLYPGVSVIYCAIPRPDPAVLSDLEACTGVPTREDIGGTVDLLFKLRPETRLVVAVTDDTEQGARMRRAAEQAMTPYLDRTQLLFPGFEAGDDTELNLDMLGDVLSSIPHDGVVLYLGYAQETDGLAVSVTQIVRLIKERSVAPVFTVKGRLLFAEGTTGLVVGGSVASPEAIGRKAMQTLARVAQGEDPAEMLVEPVTPEVVLDDVALKRFGMTPPQGATVIRAVARGVSQRGGSGGDTVSPWLFPAGISVALFAVFLLVRRLGR